MHDERAARAELAALWKIDEARLPPGSSILYRQVGVWDLYKPQIIGAIFLLAVQTALIGALLLQRSRGRRIQNALLDSQQRYTLASAAGAVGVWDWNFETNELFVDPGLKAILGFDDAEISTRPDDWGSRVHPQDLPVADAGVKNCIDGITDSYEIEHRMVHKDGSVKWMLSRGSALRGPNKNLRRLVGTKVDITERKLAEDAIRESQAVLEAQEQTGDLLYELVSVKKKTFETRALTATRLPENDFMSSGRSHAHASARLPKSTRKSAGRMRRARRS